MATDDQRVIELLQNFAFVPNTVVVVNVNGDFENKPAFVLLNQKRDRCRARPELADDRAAAMPWP